MMHYTASCTEFLQVENVFLNLLATDQLHFCPVTMRETVRALKMLAHFQARLWFQNSNTNGQDTRLSRELDMRWKHNGMSHTALSERNMSPVR